MWSAPRGVNAAWWRRLPTCQMFTPGVTLADDDELNVELTSTLREMNVSLLATWMFRCRTRSVSGLPFDAVMSVLAKITAYYQVRRIQRNPGLLLLSFGYHFISV
jgi:hypothetical protein